MERQRMSRRSKGISAVLFAVSALGAACSSSSDGAAPDHLEAGTHDGSGGTGGAGGGGGTALPDGSAGGDARASDGAPSTEGGGDTGVSAGNATQACTDYVAAYCDRYKACSSFYFERVYGDDATCRARNLIGCADQFTAKGTTFTPNGLAACATALPTAKCDEFIMLGRVPAACTPPAGTLPMGQSCAYDAQCAGGVCTFGSFGSCGSCSAKQQSGSTCFSAAECADGSLCLGNGGSSGNCTKYSIEGGNCDMYTPCAPWLTCKGGMCAKPQPVSSACGQNPDSPDPCDRLNGIVCDPLNMECVQLTVDTTNQDCSARTANCAASYDCDVDGTCYPPIKEGDDCQVLSGPSCLPPSRCDNGTCALPKAATCSP